MFSDVFSFFENLIEKMIENPFCRILIFIQFVCIVLYIMLYFLRLLIYSFQGRDRRRNPKNKEEEKEENSLISPNMD